MNIIHNWLKGKKYEHYTQMAKRLKMSILCTSV